MRGGHVERVADGVYQVKKGFRAFVIDGDEGLTLIDAGLPKRAGAFVEGIKSIGRSVSDINSILLTHNHADHAGSVAALKRDSGAALYCSAADAPAVRGHAKTTLPPFLDRTPLQVLKPLMRLLPSADPTEVDHEIEASEPSGLPEDLTATATAGHTAGHTSYLLDRAGGILFVGDAAHHRRGKVSRGWFNRPTPDIDGSLQALAELDFETACFGHADPISVEAAAAFRRFVAKM
jgi:glyoxylase-like metal-dependent hydrolase (beta-lactamase superfamily II)